MVARRWLKGNIHTHTQYSDGDSAPEVVVDWYAENGYDFLFLTDHNVILPQQHLTDLQRPNLAVWPGEEISMGVVHINGLGLRDLIMPAAPFKNAIAEPYIGEACVDRMCWAVEQVRAQDAVAVVNHPNLWDALAVDDLLRLPDGCLLEVSNMTPTVSKTNPGGAHGISTEQLWDALLTAGQRVWGVATDDAHYFAAWGPEFSNPGRGWLQVESEDRALGACLSALRQGRFYASIGPALAEYRADQRELVIELATGAATIELVGAEGCVLDTADGSAARFDLQRIRSPYVRARVIVDGRAWLWTQPIRLHP